MPIILSGFGFEDNSIAREIAFEPTFANTINEAISEAAFPATAGSDVHVEWYSAYLSSVNEMATTTLPASTTATSSADTTSVFSTDDKSVGSDYVLESSTIAGIVVGLALAIGLTVVSVLLWRKKQIANFRRELLNLKRKGFDNSKSAEENGTSASNQADVANCAPQKVWPLSAKENCQAQASIRLRSADKNQVIRHASVPLSSRLNTLLQESIGPSKSNETVRKSVFVLLFTRLMPRAS